MAKKLQQGEELEAWDARMRQRDQRREPAPGGAKPRMYEVQSGDSLSKIAKEIYGDASRWNDIFEANRDKLSDPDEIRVGQELVIPE
jgi:nucleoid-associated protein YgaU